MGISAHGSSISRNGEVIPDVGNITPPELSREMADDTKHQGDEQWMPGHKHTGELTFETLFRLQFQDYLLKEDDFNLLLEGGGSLLLESMTLNPLVEAWVNETLDDYVFTFAGGATWEFSGMITNITPLAPVDGILRARISVRSSGTFELAPGPNLLLTQLSQELLTQGGQQLSV